MTDKEYPELKEYKKFADAMGAELEVKFTPSEESGIYDVDVLIGGVPPIGPRFFSFDKKRIFNFWSDYPDKLTSEQIKKFNKWNDILAALKNYGGYPPEKDKQAQDSEVKKDVWSTRF